MIQNTDNLVFVAFNSRVTALDADSGSIVWKWHAPTGTGFVTVLPFDELRLIVSVVGYTYCLNAATGDAIWFNEMTGMGTGVVSLATTRSVSASQALAGAAEDAAQSTDTHERSS